MADAEFRGRVAQRQPIAVLLGGTVAVDAMHPSPRGDTVRRPGLPFAGWHSHSVQRSRDILIRPTSGHTTHDSECLLWSMTAVLAGSRLTNAQLGMLTALPMDDEHDLGSHLVDINNNLGDQRPDQSLARPHRGLRRLPSRHQIIGQAREVGTNILDITRLHSINLLSATLNTLQCTLPGLFQLRCNQAVVRVASSVAAFSKRRIMASLLQLQLGDAPSILIFVSQHTFGLLSRFNRHRCYDAEHPSCNYLVDVLATEPDTTPLAWLHVRLVTLVNLPGITTNVHNTEPSSTARATDEASQQCVPAPSGFRVTDFAECVPGKQRLIAFKLLPADIAFVMILDEHLPCIHRLAMTIALSRPAIDDRCTLLTLSIRIDAGVERVLENRDDIAISDRPPFERRKCPSV